jgi:hypothetical protein
MTKLNDTILEMHRKAALKKQEEAKKNWEETEVVKEEEQIDELTTADFNKQFRDAYNKNPGGIANIGGKNIALKLAKPGNLTQRASGGSAIGSKVAQAPAAPGPANIVSNKSIINKGVSPGNVPAILPGVRDLNTVKQGAVKAAPAPKQDTFFGANDAARAATAAKIAAGGAQNVAAPVVAQTPKVVPTPPTRPQNVGTPQTFLQKQGIGVKEETTMNDENHKNLLAAFDALMAKNSPNMFAEAKKKGDGNLANNYPPYDKVTRGDVIAGRLGKDHMGGKMKKEAVQGDDDGDDTKKMPKDYGESVEQIDELMGKGALPGMRNKYHDDHEYHAGLADYHQMQADRAADRGDKAGEERHMDAGMGHDMRASELNSKLHRARALDAQRSHAAKVKEYKAAAKQAKMQYREEVEVPAPPSKHVAMHTGTNKPLAGDAMHEIDADDSGMPKKKAANPAHSTAAPDGMVPANKPAYTTGFANPGKPGAAGKSVPPFPNPGTPGTNTSKGQFPNPIHEGKEVTSMDAPVEHHQQMHASKMIKAKTGRKVYFDDADMVDHKTSKTITRNALGKHSMNTLISHAKNFSEEVEKHGGKEGQRARLAMTLSKMHKEGFEVEFSEEEIEAIHAIYEDNMPATTDRTDPTENGSAPGRSDGYDRADRRVLTDQKKSLDEETEDRPAREHIQVLAGRAAGGADVTMKHGNGKSSKITPAMGRKITAHLNGLKPAARQDAVKRMHASPEGLNV